MAAESKKTVLAALAANAVIAVAKFIGGLLSGSAAMLAEAAHSVADTVNQGFLLLSLALGARRPDEQHPFGHGKERFFWAFVAAVFIFVAGAVFSIGEGVRSLLSESGEAGSALVSYIVLGVALAAESAAWVRAFRQVRSAAGRLGRGVRAFLRVSRDPTVKTALFEDSAAVLGVLVAFGGLGLHQATGDHRWDAAASIVIGLILAVAAFVLARDTKGLLLGEAALPEERDRLRRAIEGAEGVEGVGELLTMALGPEALLVTARLNLRSGLDADDVERLAGEVDRRCREAVPAVTEVFLDPTPAR